MTRENRRLLRLEGLAVLLLAVWLYARGDGGWGFFALLILAPDLFMLGYLEGPGMGARVYNLGHTYAVPVAIGIVGAVSGSATTLQVALIWTAHIGVDRVLGYGLKETTGFTQAHLGPVGKGIGRDLDESPTVHTTS
jgi:hypothetical protein